jgi:hypothetical protein
MDVSETLKCRQLNEEMEELSHLAVKRSMANAEGNR